MVKSEPVTAPNDSQSREQTTPEFAREITEPTHGVPVRIWDTDEPSRRGIDGVDRMRLIRDDIADRVRELADELLAPERVPQR